MVQETKKLGYCWTELCGGVTVRCSHCGRVLAVGRFIKVLHVVALDCRLVD